MVRTVLLTGPSVPAGGPARLLPPPPLSFLLALPPGNTRLSFRLSQTDLIRDLQRRTTEPSPQRAQAGLASALGHLGSLEYCPHGLCKEGSWGGKGRLSRCPRSGTSRQLGWGHRAEQPGSRDPWPRCFLDRCHQACVLSPIVCSPSEVPRPVAGFAGILSCPFRNSGQQGKLKA